MTHEEFFGSNSQWTADQLRRLQVVCKRVTPEERARAMANMPPVPDPDKETCEDMMRRVEQDDGLQWEEANRPLQVVRMWIEMLRIGSAYTEGDSRSVVGDMYTTITTIPGLLLRQTQARPPLFEVIPAATPVRPRWTALKTVARRCRNAWKALAGKNEDSEG